MQKIDVNALMHIKACRHKLTWQQYSTLKGQILAGDSDGAMRGLRRLLQRGS